MMYWTSLYSPPQDIGHDPLAPVPLLVTSGDHHWRPVQTCSLDLIVQVPMVLISGSYVWLASEWCTSSRNAFLLPPAKEVWGKVMFLHLSVSHSVHGEVMVWSGLGRHPPADTPWAETPLGRHPPAQWDTVNKRVVRIPLECILVVK